jgi:hypothetical protein
MYIPRFNRTPPIPDWPSGGGIKTVAELGHFMFDENRPWETIKFCGPDAMPVCEYFTVESPTNRVERGQINVNSEFREALASAFYGMQADAFPGSTVPVAERQLTIDRDMALAIADLIISKAGNAATVFDAFRSITYNDFYEVIKIDNKWLVDEIIARSYDLMGARQNLFQILVSAQSIKGQDVMGERQAVVTVWRDPWPDTTGSHQLIIRSFRYLD